MNTRFLGCLRWQSEATFWGRILVECCWGPNCRVTSCPYFLVPIISTSMTKASKRTNGTSKISWSLWTTIISIAFNGNNFHKDKGTRNGKGQAPKWSTLKLIEICRSSRTVSSDKCPMSQPTKLATTGVSCWCH